jgi:hypothetical protein
MEITRKRVNRGVRSYLLKIGGYVIRHPDFDDKHPAYYNSSFRKNMTINMVNNIIIHISNWFHEME